MTSHAMMSLVAKFESLKGENPHLTHILGRDQRVYAYKDDIFTMVDIVDYDTGCYLTDEEKPVVLYLAMTRSDSVCSGTKTKTHRADYFLRGDYSLADMHIILSAILKDRIYPSSLGLPKISTNEKDNTPDYYEFSSISLLNHKTYTADSISKKDFMKRCMKIIAS